MFRSVWLIPAVVLGTTVPALAEPPQPPASREPVSFRDVVRKVVPAVVNIEVRAGKSGRTGAGDGSSLGFGSGFLIDPAGVVLTNSHVVEGAAEVVVEFGDGRKFTAKDIRRDPKTDLAIIQLTSDKPLPFLVLGDSDAMEVGDRVLAVGAPFGLAGSVTQGIVSAKSRRNLKLNQYEDFLQTDAAINPGNSGGPLVNLDGQAIGVTAAIKTKSGGFQGVGLAVSSNLARDVVKQLLADGVVRRGYLGVSVRGRDGEAGVLITKVEPGSPAARAGLRVGDVLASIAGTDVRDPTALPRLISGLPPGKPTGVIYVRNGKPVAVEVTIEELPEETSNRKLVEDRRPVAPGVRTAPGLSVGELTADEAARLGHPRGTRGVVVTAVEPNGLAAGSGLAPGSVIIRVDRTAIASVAEFQSVLAAADPDRGALLSVRLPSGEVVFTVLRLR
jgi:serine protease Do